MHKHIMVAVGGVLAAVLLSGAVWATTPPAGDAKYNGVDIYHGTSENGQIDWDKLATSQDFAYIKADEGESWVDPEYRANVAAAKARGMAWGTYHFLRLYSPASARVQADNYWNRIKGTGYTLIPAVDVESHDGQDTAAGMRACVRAFVEEFKAVSGITPVLYTYTSYATDYLRGDFTDCPLWLADYRGYAGDIVGWGSWHAWQYSENGTIEAIANNEVDLDHATSGIWMDPAQAPAPKTAQAVSVPGTVSATPAAQTGDPSVRAHQTAWNSLRIYPSVTVDGLDGPETRRATKALQWITGITQDSVWGSQTQAAYQSIVSRPTLRQGSTGAAVRYVQICVGADIDGKFGPATAAAVRAWQRAHGLNADGIVGRDTWAALLA